MDYVFIKYLNRIKKKTFAIFLTKMFLNFWSKQTILNSVCLELLQAKVILEGKSIK